ncbi:SRPBCC domain-containing protein [Streptomyces sp. MBT84]|uniref:SRPBCC domain-containing protein n=1 Tax=Streptomyces sp. MBT84 TaxID=1488414 RepID=UPI002076B027|nr:SRPBCC domain-containing protein [Streptomyces sp. MBT84]
MNRIDRASRLISASPAAVYDALLDRESLEVWLPPEGMRGHVERWDPRPGGGFRMVLTYLDPAESPVRLQMRRMSSTSSSRSWFRPRAWYRGRCSRPTTPRTRAP